MKAATNTNAGTRKVKKKTKAQLLKERRKIRTSLGSMKRVMQIPEIPGKVVRIVNDTVKMGRSRVAQLQDIGWEVYDGETVEIAPPNNVTASNISLGKGVTTPVGTDEKGSAIMGILMCIDEDIYRAYQALKAEEIQATEVGIFAQGDDDPNSDLYGSVRIGT